MLVGRRSLRYGSSRSFCQRFYRGGPAALKLPVGGRAREMEERSALHPTIEAMRASLTPRAVASRRSGRLFSLPARIRGSNKTGFAARPLQKCSPLGLRCAALRLAAAARKRRRARARHLQGAIPDPRKRVVFPRHPRPGSIPGASAWSDRASAPRRRIHEPASTQGRSLQFPRGSGRRAKKCRRNTRRPPGPGRISPP